MNTLLKWLSVVDRFSKLHLDKQLASHGINSSQHMFLIKICEHPGLLQDSLIDTIYLHPSNIVRTVASLENKGLLIRTPCEEDKRTCRLYPTNQATKPFVIGALQRKIKAMFSMLEHHKPAKDIYDDGRLFLDFSEQTASLNGKPLTLSPMEYKMLNLFRKNPKQVLTRQQLLEKLWDVDEKFVDEHTLTTTVSRIRSKIEADGGTPYIKTIYGMGYQWMGGEAK